MTLARRAVLVAGAVAVLAVAWLAWGWFKDSSLVQVRHVEISGVTNGPDGPAIKRQLRHAATGMTSLDVDKGRLTRAVAAYPIVKSVSASGKFPSTLRVKVNEYVPVAALTGPDGRAVPVAFDGTLLPRAQSDKLPAVAVTAAPERNGFESRRVATLVRVLAAAPAPLRSQLDRAYLDADKGIVVMLHGGPGLDFGTSGRLVAKWASAARVLAAPSSSGATTIDVRVPERPAAAGFGSQQQALAPVQNPQG
jgi:cell division protein FtsQ